MEIAFRRAVAEARESGNLCFASLLSEHRIDQAMGAARALWQGWIYTPAATVWVFLAQCLSRDHSCRDAVAQLIAWRLSRNLPACSAETGAYCQAREALPEEACRRLVRDTSPAAGQAPSSWLWHGRQVVVGDGSTITMADSAENQAEYPQMACQAPGCGFPIARIVVLFSLAVGTVLDAAISPYQGKQTGEPSLFRQLHDVLKSGDIYLGDRCFSGWWDLALLSLRKVDVVVRKHQGRPTDFRTGHRLGKDDHRVVWQKPSRPEWMTEEQYALLPAELTLREVRVRVKRRGFRCKEILVVTSLLDSQKYSASEIGELFRRRWQAELNLRSLKTVLEMDHLRCKTPHRARNEFYMHLVAYNLIRQTVAVAAHRAATEPWTISFKGALQTMNHLVPVLDTLAPTDDWCAAVLGSIAAHRVADRPDRCEPRVLKRRGKTYSLMNQPRAQYKKKTAA